MLTPSYLLHAVEPAEDIAEELHQNIMNRIIERILIRFGRGDDYILTPLDKYQIETLQRLGYLLGDIRKEIAKATGKMQTEIAAAMEDAGVKALEYDDAIYREAGLNPTPLIQSPYLQKLMQDTYEQTFGEWKNFTSTTADAAQETFRRLCDEAYIRYPAAGAAAGRGKCRDCELRRFRPPCGAGLQYHHQNRHHLH